jgi:putative DNA primase/helicase
MTHTNGAVAEPPAWFFDPDNQFSAPPPATNKAAGPAPEPALEPRFIRSTLSSLINRPPKEWMIDNIIGPKDMMMIYGPSGSGKTFVVIDLIFAASLGQQFAMRFDVARPLSVAYCAGEGLGGLPQRFAAAAAFYGVEDMPNFTFFEEIPQLYDLTAPTNALTFVEEWKKDPQPLDILIIDTLHSATVGADENSGKDMGIVLQSCKYLRDQLGCVVCLVHHTNKAGIDERGHSSLKAAMDMMIKVEKAPGDDSKLAYISCAKPKDGEKWTNQSFDLSAKGDSVRVWWNLPADVVEGDKRKTETAKEILKLLGEKPDRTLAAKK